MRINTFALEPRYECSLNIQISLEYDERERKKAKRRKMKKGRDKTKKGREDERKKKEKVIV